ncbi:MAG: hypothetical protein DRP74_05370 [Candidatus Omnitrophota bacterium]|nr:MAG: hypothetical protein DRP74_05370 [Candidatus Omnitrophota bacterium]
MKNFIKIICVNIIILIILFFLFEAGLRLFWQMSALKGELYKVSKNRILRYELRPNAVQGRVHINSDGFRDKDYSLVKPQGVFRIIVLGDSEAFSQSLALEDTMPKKLEVELNKNCLGLDFEVLNMGVEGYNTIQEWEFLKVKGLKYNPDLVILYYTFNDPDYPEYYFKKNFFNRYFLTIRYFQYRLKKALIRRDRRIKGIKSEKENFEYLYSTSAWDHSKEAILKISALADENKFQFAIVVNPEMSSAVLNFRDGYPYWYINEKLKELEKNNIAVIDPTYLFKEKDSKVLDLVIGPHDRYKNAEANSNIAEYILKEFYRRRIINCSGPQY